jgi:hypothetical protein
MLHHTRSFYVGQNALLHARQDFGLALVGNNGSDRNPSWYELPLYRNPNNGELWYAATPYQKYGIEFLVPDHGRHYAVTTVDGKNIMTGERSSGSGSEQGWILSPAEGYGNNVVPGWYQDSGKVAAFQFAPSEISLAALSDGDTSNNGVVAARYFFERPRPKYRDNRRRGGGTRSMRGGDGLESLGGDIGTGMGEDVEFHTSTSTFSRDTTRRPVTCLVRYAKASDLIRSGFVLVNGQLPGASSANPFPEEGPGGVPRPDGNPLRRDSY